MELKSIDKILLKLFFGRLPRRRLDACMTLPGFSLLTVTCNQFIYMTLD